MAVNSFDPNIFQQAIDQSKVSQQALTVLGGQQSTPSTPNPLDKDVAKSDMTEATQRNRTTTPDKIRWCDVREGDILLISGSSGDEYRGVVQDEGATWHVQWSDGGEWHDLGKADTSLISNYHSGCRWSPKNIKKVARDGVSFDSVILEDHKKGQIVAAISQVDNHDLIFNQWGFGDVFEKGTAISLLFYGPPGTGKTLMAQAIADRYGYRLKVIGTAEIQTPEPGGAERNLKKTFTEAGKDTVLLFDECDSLITDRARVGMILAAQINALLTSLEAFTGIAIFTTNRMEALDPAFERRLSLKLEFAMPDAAHREAIWKRMFPKKAPLAPDIRWDDLASIEIAGGHIKNVVLKAARMAAAQGATQITDDIIWEALEREVESMTAFTDAVDSYNPWYGAPVKGGAAGGGLVRRPGSVEVGHD